MEIESKSILYDIQQAVNLISQFTLDAGFSDYENNAMIRSAVERQFEIIGEAVNRLSEFNPGLAHRISERRRIINFRNQLIHGYSVVDDRVVWDVIQTKLPILAEEVRTMLQDAGGTK